jgi:hypothetical protein
VPTSAGLSSRTTAFNVDENVKPGQRICYVEGLSNYVVQALVVEIVGHFTIINGNLSLAVPEIYPRYCGFPPTGSKCQIFCHYSLDSLQFDPLGFLSGVRMAIVAVHFEVGK